MSDLFNKVLDEENIKLAIQFTIAGMRKELYCNSIQLEYCKTHQKKYTKRIMSILKDYKNYRPSLAIKAIKHKNEFAIRNLIVLDIDDAIIRTCLALVFANELEKHLIDNCFSNRRGDQLSKNNSLFEDYSQHGWQNFCDWQITAVSQYSLLLKSDISSFYDSIGQEYLIHAARDVFQLSRSDPVIQLLTKSLRIKHVYSSSGQPVEVKHGITIGTLANHVFANLFLHQIDLFMHTIDGISYGRYVDDIRIFANSKDAIMKSLQYLQMKLFNAGLNLNGAKTAFAGNKRLLDRLVSEKLFTYLDVEEDRKYKPPTPGKIVRIEEDLGKYQISVQKDTDLPLNGISKDLREWKGVKLAENTGLITEYFHTLNHLIDSDHKRIDFKIIDKIFMLLVASPKNEKYACWLISRMIIDFRFEEGSRVRILTRVLNLMVSRKITAYSQYRFMYILGIQPYIEHYDYSLLNYALGGLLRDRFIKAVGKLLNSQSLILQITGLHAVKVYNESHTKDLSIKVRLYKEIISNGILKKNRDLLRKLPKAEREFKVTNEEVIEQVIG